MTASSLGQKAENSIAVNVALGARSYDIEIGTGLIDRAGELIGPHLRRPVTAIVTDENVAGLHLDRLTAALEAAGIASTAVICPPGEASKSYARLASVCDGLLEAGIERSDTIIAFGGGVIGDLAGFAAAILRRGVRFIQMPTSLLAQVDSSVGGKTGINSPLGKNLIGAFHQPVGVIADISLLDTLPARQFAAGYAEVAKYGLIGDAAFFGWLEDHGEQIGAGDLQARMRAVETSCVTKADIVARDEHEHGTRALLNLGHTFGHALEAATGYGERLLHGEGVSIGMIMALRFSHRLGLCSADVAERAAAHLASVGLPVSAAQIPGGLPDADGLLNIMRQDKKAEGGSLVFILARGIGEAFIARNIDDAAVLEFLNLELSNR